MSDSWTLVTGASDGIGAAFARIAAAEGRALILSARREDRLEALAAELRAAHGVKVVVIPADLATPAGADTLWREAATGRRVDFLMNNAGLGRNGPFAADPEAGWPQEAASLAVNVAALTRLMKLAAAHMRRAGGGRILNTASVAGFMPGPGMAVYHAGKAYVVSLSRAVGAELAGSGVTVSALCPGPTESGFFDVADMRGAPLLSILRPMSAAAVARAGYRGALRGRAVIAPGLLNRFLILGAKFSPVSLNTFLAKQLMSNR
ncbi:MAG: SDR family NAD(P)-dependent oxidoreductase [Pikeienuella sp.]